MFDYKDLTIAIVGGGISGSYIACMLARDRYRITLFQNSSPSEPESLLIFPKTYRNFLLLKVFEKEFDGTNIPRVRFLANGREGILQLDEPLLMVSRSKVEQSLLNTAKKSGAKIFDFPVQSIREEEGFVLEGESRRFGADFIIGADGPNGLVSKHVLKTSCIKESHGVVYSFFPSVQEEDLVVHFLPQLPGYLWFMPTQRGTFAGIREILPLKRYDLLRKTLHQYALFHYGRSKIGAFSAQNGQVPIPQKSDFLFQTYMGPNWSLVGGAAGLVDPLMGVSSSQAIDSAYFFCDAFSKIRPSQYPGSIKTELYEPIMSSLELLPQLRKSKFVNFFVSAVKKSPAFQKLLKGIFSGNLPYDQFKNQMHHHSFKIWSQVLLYNLGKKTF